MDSDHSAPASFENALWNCFVSGEIETFQQLKKDEATSALDVTMELSEEKVEEMAIDFLM